MGKINAFCTLVHALLFSNFISGSYGKINTMKKILYIIIILVFFAFLLKGCLKQDKGYDEPPKFSDARALDITEYNFPPAETKTINGVDYLVSRTDIGKYGGDFVTSTIGEGPKTFNPFNTNDATSSQMASLMYDGLLSTDAYTGDVTLRMAKRLEILPDDMTYILELRHGLKWSDGKEITADDVVFTYKDIIFAGYGDTSTRDALYVEGKLPMVEKVDKYTVKFRTPVPFAPFLRNLSLSIAPKHVFKPAVDKGKDYFRSFYSTTTKPSDFVVSGAFKLKEYIPAQRVIFERNPNYYVIDKEGNKLPYLDRWVILIVGDLNNDIIKFEAGETDTTTIPGSMVSRYRELEKNSDYTLYNLGPTTNTSFIAFNMNTRKDKKGKFYLDPKKQLWFNDDNFRSAIDWAIDRDSLVLNVLSGVGQPLYTAESITSIFLNEEVAKGHEQDIEYAKSLLEKSGFKLKDGILYDKYGNRVEFELSTNAGNTQREATGVSIKEDLAKLGMKVNFKPVEFNTLVNRLTQTLDYEAAIMSLTSNPLEPHAGNNVWRSDGTLHLFNQRSHEDMKSTDRLLPFETKLNKIFDEAKVQIDVQKRKELYNEYQKIVAENNPLIYLYSPVNIVAVRKKFKNVYPTSLGGAVHNIEEIYIEK